MNALRVIDGKPITYADIFEVELEWYRGNEPVLTVTYEVSISFEEETRGLPPNTPILPTGIGMREFKLTAQDALSFLDKYRILAKKASQ